MARQSKNVLHGRSNGLHPGKRRQRDSCYLSLLKGDPATRGETITEREYVKRKI